MLMVLLAMVFLFPAPSTGDPRTQTVQVKCSGGFQHNSTSYQPNYASSMFNLSTQLQSSLFASSSSGPPSSPDASFALSQCYSDLSLLDCQLCFSEARTLLPQCFPRTGGRVFLDGCFLRSQNYSFFSEISATGDGPVCSNRTSSSSSNPSFRSAVDQSAAAALQKAAGDGFGRSSAEISGNGSSVYAMAICWETLNGSACAECLRNASDAARGCLPAPEGRGLMAGCFFRYSDFDFLNRDPSNRRSNSKTLPFQFHPSVQ